MKVDTIKLCTLIVCTALHISCNITTKERQWLNYLLKDIHSHQVYQVLLLHDQDTNNADYEVAKIIKRIAEEIPTRKITFQEATVQNSERLSLTTSFYEPQATTLTVVIDVSVGKETLSKLKEPINFLTKLSEARSRPKCLFIFLKKHKKSTYEELLQNMWTSKFLDTTLLEINLKEREENESAKMHIYNPFTETFKRETYKTKSSLFPEKLLNMYGYPFKVDLFNTPPLASITRNLTGHVENVFGPDVTVTQILSKAMNFRILWIASNDTFWTNSNCTKNETTGIIYRLAYNEVQFLARRTGRIATCDKLPYEWSTCIRMASMRIVVPYTSNKSTEVSSEWRLSNIFIVSSFLLLSWIFTRLLHFNQHNWRFPHLVQIMLGLTTPLEPRRLVERILFGSMLLTCLLNSSFIYITFTEVIFQKESKQALETIQNVTDSGLTPVLHSSAFFYFNSSAEDSLRLFLDKAMIANVSYEECLELLIQNNSISCIVLDSVAEMIVKSTKDEFGQPLLKIVKEPFQNFPSCYILEAASPFLSRINDILLRLARSGIFEDVKGNYFNASLTERGEHNSKDEEVESIQVRRLVIILLFYGYLCSLFAFLCEILVFIFSKRGRNQHCC